MQNYKGFRVGSKISQVFPINEKETRCCHILFAKCPVFFSNVRLGFCRKLNDETWIELMRRDGFYHSAFVLQKPNRTLLSVFRTFANRLCEVVFDRSLCVCCVWGSWRYSSTTSGAAQEQ